MRVAVALVALVGIAHAQQLPLPEHLRDLAKLRIGSTQITQEQQFELDVYKQAHPDVSQLDPATFSEVAQSVCAGSTDSSCVPFTENALTCLAGGCQVFNPLPDPPALPSCDPYVNQVRSARAGLGFEWGTGWQDDRFPVDGRAWSLGYEARRRMTKQFGLVARLDRSTGRDRAEDANRDGRDDLSTGKVTRMYALAGPSYMFGIQHDRDVVRYTQLDLLAGYQYTLGLEYRLDRRKWKDRN